MKVSLCLLFCVFKRVCGRSEDLYSFCHLFITSVYGGLQPKCMVLSAACIKTLIGGSLLCHFNYVYYRSIK
ncbi:hypothetical protein M758_11G129000 [Ceratodon purpureus]|uniref:Secreted protein n=1 Tax=Ceratodon purpureus TaxID=3225 RepID=A0A8T0GI80_CERPU|nr:hypothetical protein KC19_11G133000 [Ceratodon purpureus]KAG0601646.1 hypothetical protein M758_11G129000 [Ceratodon purpureus]